MYIPYDKIGRTIALFFPKQSKNILETAERKRLEQNLNYISKNKKKVLRRLRKKIKKEKLIVAFYVFDDPKWKCQSLYNLMEESKYFIPYIHATKNRAVKTGSSYQPPELVHKTYNFFKEKGMRVLYNYDVDKQEFIPTKNMKPRPDIIFYQHPWYVETSQGPVRNSSFALTYYVPYFLATSISPIEYYLRFHKYIETHYVLNEQIKQYFSENMENKGANLKAVGHPQLDYFYLNKNKQYENKEWVIFAPHWSIDELTILNWGTFQWSGEFMLEYAKKHPEYNWVFKPHPGLIQLLRMRHWKEDKIQKYWNDWAKIGVVCEEGDYLDMFMESKLMITDCGSFQTEYFMTHKPCIYLKSANGTPFNPAVQSIVENYYTVKNQQELEEALNKVLIKGEDDRKEQRLKAYDKLGYNNNYAAQNIMQDLLDTLGVK